jgi:hypothetical protein
MLLRQDIGFLRSRHDASVYILSSFILRVRYDMGEYPTATLIV